MSIENKNEYEYDSNNINNKQIFSKKFKKIDIPSYKKLNTELGIENNDDKNYRTINFDINSIFNLSKHKFRSTTVNQLIKDLIIKNENKEQKDIKSSYKESNYKQIFKDINKKIESIKNKLNIIKINQKLINNNDIKDNKDNITISPKINIKKIGKIKEINKNNNHIIHKILLKNKKIKKINFIPKNPNYNKNKTIDNSINKLILNQNNYVNSPNSSNFSKINYSQNSNSKIIINKNYKKSSFELNSKDKSNCSKYYETPIKLLNEKNSENIMHTLDISSPKYNINLAKRILRNNINKNNNKVFNDIKKTLLNIRNNRSYQQNDIK